MKDINEKIGKVEQSFIENVNKLISATGDLGFSKGDISDGSHTFDELYYHRMTLFSIICNQNKIFAWKSYTHDDGEVWDGYFIVGITTPEGEYTYHYQNQYWDNFNVKELDKAPAYDGHTAKDITRLFSLIKKGDKYE